MKKINRIINQIKQYKTIFWFIFKQIILIYFCKGSNAVNLAKTENPFFLVVQENAINRGNITPDINPALSKCGARIQYSTHNPIKQTIQVEAQKTPKNAVTPYHHKKLAELRDALPNVSRQDMAMTQV